MGGELKVTQTEQPEKFLSELEGEMSAFWHLTSVETHCHVTVTAEPSLLVSF